MAKFGIHEDLTQKSGLDSSSYYVDTALSLFHGQMSNVAAEMDASLSLQT